MDRCTQDGPELGHEYLGARETEADGPPPQEGVLLASGNELGEDLVPADVEGPDRDRVAGKGLENPTIGLVLLLLAGDVSRPEKEELGTGDYWASETAFTGLLSRLYEHGA